MSGTRHVRRAVRWTAGGFGLVIVAYAAYVGTAWYQYGHAASPIRDEVDALLDDFMPEYEVAERHQVRRNLKKEAEHRARRVGNGEP